MTTREQGLVGVVSACVLAIGMLGFVSTSSAAPYNDDLADASLLWGAPGQYVNWDTTSGATAEAGEPLTMWDEDPFASVWYRFKTVKGGIATFSVCAYTDANVSTKMVQLFRGSTFAKMNEVTSNGQSVASCKSRGPHGRHHSFQVEPKTDYRLRVSTNPGATPSDFNLFFGGTFGPAYPSSEFSRVKVTNTRTPARMGKGATATLRSNGIVGKAKVVGSKYWKATSRKVAARFSVDIKLSPTPKLRKLLAEKGNMNATGKIKLIAYTGQTKTVPFRIWLYK